VDWWKAAYVSAGVAFIISSANFWSDAITEGQAHDGIVWGANLITSVALVVITMMREEIEAYDELQAALAEATTEARVRSILDLGCGTGETAIATLKQHPQASLVGIDSSDDMLSVARRRLPSETFIASRLEDPLPHGPFDAVVSAFAIHHLDAEQKASLFRRVSEVMSPGGRFVMLAVVVPTEPIDRPIPLDEGVDMPSSVVEMLRWLDKADLRGRLLRR